MTQQFITMSSNSNPLCIPYIVMLGPIGVLTLGSAPGVGFSTQHLVKSPLFPHPTRGGGGGGGGGGGLSLIGALLMPICIPTQWLIVDVYNIYCIII